MNIDPSIFKSYDIRGIYGTQLTDDLAEKIARGFAKYLEFPQKVIVGRDGRVSGPALFERVVQGLTAVGVDVVDIGQVSSDMYYFACAEKQLPGMMITASHNPKEYNGFKMVKQIPYFLSGDEGISDIREYILQDQLPDDSETKGVVTSWEVMDAYLEKIVSLIEVDQLKQFTIHADTANGMGGVILDRLREKLPMITFIPMYWEVDGNFPNHGGDPLLEENRKELMERVPQEGSDMGIAFDPDGDRFFVVDKTGRFISGDFLTAILAEYFLNRYPGSAIVYDIRASLVVPQTIEKNGGIPLYNKVGHSHIKRRMKDEGAAFAGEVSGHYYFRDYYLVDSAAVTLLYLLDFLSKSPRSLEEIVDEMEKTYFISGEINSKVPDVAAVLQKIENQFGSSAQQILKVDGITLEMGDWRFNVRGSNTEPLIRLNLEAVNKPLMETKRDEVLELIRS